MRAVWFRSSLPKTHRGHGFEVLGNPCVRQYSQQAPTRMHESQMRRSSRDKVEPPCPRASYRLAASISHRLLSHTPPSLPSTTERSASVCRARAPPSVAFPSARERRSIKAIELSASQRSGGRAFPLDSPSDFFVVAGDSSVVVGCWGALFWGSVHVSCAVTWYSSRTCVQKILFVIRSANVRLLLCGTE